MGLSPAIVEEEVASEKKHEGTRFWQFVAAITANVATFSFGVGTGWTGPTLPHLEAEDSPLGKPMNAEAASWLSSLVFMGAICGGPLFSTISQRAGRKVSGLLTFVPFFISWLIIIFLPADPDISFPLLYFARFVAGLAVGGIVAFGPIYVGEIAEDNIRGALGSLFPLSCNAGCLFAYIVGAYLSFRMFAVVCFILPFIFVCVYFWMPETPMFLVSKGREEEAMKSLLWLRGGNKEAAKRDLAVLTTVMQDSDQQASLKEMLKNKGTRRALIITAVNCATQHLSGVYAILSYCVDILQIAGSEMEAATAAILTVALQLAGSICAPYCVERFGRRALLIGSELAMGLSLVLLGIYFYVMSLGVDLTGAPSYIPIACLALYVFFCSFGIAPVTYVIITETFRPEARGIAMSVATLLIWSFAFLVTKFYTTLTFVLGLYGCYWLFAAVCVLGSVFVIFQVPETKQRSLDSILRQLDGQKEIKPQKF